MSRHLMYPLRVHEHGRVAHITVEPGPVFLFPVVFKDSSHMSEDNFWSRCESTDRLATRMSPRPLKRNKGFTHRPVYFPNNRAVSGNTL